MSADMVNRPPHYTAHKSGVECIQLTEHLSFCLGNAVKYAWRCGQKGGAEDLAKAVWCLRREATRVDGLGSLQSPQLKTCKLVRDCEPFGSPLYLLLQYLCAFGVHDAEELRLVADKIETTGRDALAREARRL